MEDAGALVDDTMGELGAGADPELSEHFVQVVLHGAWADEQLGGDISVGYLGGRPLPDPSHTVALGL